MSAENDLQLETDRLLLRPMLQSDFGAAFTGDELVPYPYEVALMERGMLLGIKERAETMAQGR